VYKVMKQNERGFTKVDELGTDVRLDVVVHAGKADGAVMTSGLTRLTDSAFDWTFAVNEVLYIIEGRLSVTLTAETLDLDPGDMAYFSEGEQARFAAQGEALYLWVTYPTE